MNKNIVSKAGFISICILLFPVLLNAQIVFHSLEEVWKYADIHNISIQTARYDAEKAAYTQKQAYGNILPQASANGSFTDNTSLATTLIPAVILGGSPNQFIPVKFGTKYIYAGNITAQLDIVNLQSWFNIQISKYTYNYNRASYANARKSIYQQLATNYYSYLLMKEAKRLADENVFITDSVYQSAADRFKQGTVNEISVNTARINLERSQQNQITANYQMLTALNNIKQLLNMSVKDSVSFPGALQDNMDVTESAPFQPDPAIDVAYNQMKINLGQYRSSKGAFAPTLSIVYYNGTQENNNIFEPFKSDPGAPWYPAVYYSIRASVPLFTGFNHVWQLKKSKLAWQESMEQYEAEKRQSALNDENIRLNYQRSLAVLQKSKDVMQLAYDNYQHASYRYAAGIVPVDDRLNAFSNYIDYQNQYLNNLSDMLVQMYQLKIRQQSF